MRRRDRWFKRTGPSAWYSDWPVSQKKYIGTMNYVDRYIGDYTEKSVQYLDGLLPSTEGYIWRSSCAYDPAKGTSPYVDETSIKAIGNIRLTGDVAYALQPPWGRRLSNDEYVIKLLERTNPYRPTLDVPEMAFDLVEVATLFRFTWEKTLRALSNNTLQANLGWMPLVSDLKSFWGILSSIRSRMKEFESLHKKGGLHRKSDLDSFGVTESIPYTTLYSGPATIYGSFHKETKWTIRGTVRWFPNYANSQPLEDFPDSRGLDAFIHAAAVCLNLNWRTVGLETLWQALPYSWLIDYFADLSSWLNANKGRQFVTPTHICLIEETRTVDTAKGISASFDWLYPGSSRTETNIRYRQVYPTGYDSYKVPLNSVLTTGNGINIAALLGRLRR